MMTMIMIMMVMMMMMMITMMTMMKESRKRVLPTCATAAAEEEDLGVCAQREGQERVSTSSRVDSTAVLARLRKHSCVRPSAMGGSRGRARSARGFSHRRVWTDNSPRRTHGACDIQTAHEPFYL